MFFLRQLCLDLAVLTCWLGRIGVLVTLGAADVDGERRLMCRISEVNSQVSSINERISFNSKLQQVRR